MPLSFGHRGSRMAARTQWTVGIARAAKSDGTVGLLSTDDPDQFTSINARCTGSQLQELCKHFLLEVAEQQESEPTKAAMKAEWV